MGYTNENVVSNAPCLEKDYEGPEELYGYPVVPIVDTTAGHLFTENGGTFNLKETEYKVHEISADGHSAFLIVQTPCGESSIAYKIRIPWSEPPFIQDGYGI